MARLQHIEIDGNRYLWRDLLQLRREQKKTQAPIARQQAAAANRTVLRVKPNSALTIFAKALCRYAVRSSPLVFSPAAPSLRPG